MAREPVSAEAVVQAILRRINSGLYAPGDRLPPVRKLALEIGSKRDTVNKAYQMLLDMGVIELSPSGWHGYIVRRREGGQGITKNELLNYFYSQFVELTWQGMAAGLSSEELVEIQRKAVSEVYGQSMVEMIFYECNDYDTTEMGKRLNEVLNLPVEYKNISHFYKNPAAVLNTRDLIITTYHHLAELTNAIRQQGFPASKVVGIDTRLTADSLLKIARLPKERIAVICTNQNTAVTIQHILYGYRPEWQIEAASTEDPERVRKLVEWCDHLIVTHTSADPIQEWCKRMPDVVVNFQIDEQSIAFLNQRIQQIRLQKLHGESSTNISQGALDEE
jgi:GntR family transcriptional regulator